MLARQRQFAERSRLSAVYFFYFACLGALLPYWSLYLQHLDFTADQIGELSAVLLGTKIIAPGVWGWVADHTSKQMRWARVAVFAGMCIFSMVLLVRGYWPLLLVLAGFGFFWNAALPQFETTTMNHLHDDKYLYSRIRLWGSIGFIASVSILAPVLQNQGIGLLPWAILVILFCIWINTLLVQDKPSGTMHAAKASLLKTCLDPSVLALLLAAFLIQMSHGPYYTFFSIYLEEYGYSRTAVGQFWSLGVVAEIILFFMAYRLLPRFGAKYLLMLAMLLTALRWWMIAMFADNLPVLLLAQLLHAASYGLFHASAIYLIDQYFSGSIQGRGMALYSSISFGLGASLGSLMSGYTWNTIGSSEVYMLAMAIAALALVQYVWLARPVWKRVRRRNGTV